MRHRPSSPVKALGARISRPGVFSMTRRFLLTLVLGPPEGRLLDGVLGELADVLARDLAHGRDHLLAKLERGLLVLDEAALRRGDGGVGSVVRAQAARGDARGRVRARRFGHRLRLRPRRRPPSPDGPRRASTMSWMRLSSSVATGQSFT